MKVPPPPLSEKQPQPPGGGVGVEVVVAEPELHDRHLTLVDAELGHTAGHRSLRAGTLGERRGEHRAQQPGGAQSAVKL